MHSPARFPSAWAARISAIISGAARSISRIARICARCRGRCPPLSALREAMALPSGVRGPVDFAHGLLRRIASAAFARRSGVHALDLPMIRH